MDLAAYFAGLQSALALGNLQEHLQFLVKNANLILSASNKVLMISKSGAFSIVNLKHSKRRIKNSKNNCSA